MRIINLTPHAVVVCGSDGVPVAEFPPTGKVARARQVERPVGELEVAPGLTAAIVEMAYGEPEDLPGPEEGTYCIVSILTAQAAKAAGRQTSDLLVTTDPVRDAAGKIIGCRKFAII